MQLTSQRIGDGARARAERTNSTAVAGLLESEIALSIVIAAFNGARTIGAQLAAIASQDGPPPHEVIVSDNGSTDETLRVVEGFRARLPMLRVVDSSDRRGTAHARNVGIRAATGNAIAILDQDDVVAAGWLDAMRRALAEHEFVASRRDGECLNPEWARTARPVPQARELIGGRFLPHGGGCSLGFRREVFDRVGGLDESYRFLDDVDFCYRAQLAGTALVFAPEPLLHYRVRHTLRGLYRQARSYAEEHVRIYRTYLPRGMPPVAAREALRALRWRLELFAERPHGRGELGRRAWELGWLVGYLRGCVKYRTIGPYPS